LDALLALINCRLGDNGLPAIKQFAEISKAEARALFVVLGTMLEYAGYREEANRYSHMLATVTCPVCKQRFVLADRWGGGDRPVLGNKDFGRAGR
jgi:hypothetical protein